MVKQTKFKGKKTYTCESCGFHYLEKETARKCENFCSTNNMCSPEITKTSIERAKA